jgi:threonine-phosphate decarboxylase
MNESVPGVLPAHGGQLRQLAGRYGVASELLLDFSANINPAGPPPSVLLALRQALANPETLITYPDLELTDLKQGIADCTKVHPQNVVVANGFVPLLEAALRSLNIEHCLLPVPAFSEYRKTLENGKVAVTPYQLSPATNFSYDPDAILQALERNACDAILLANPQNPSGVLCESKQMMRLIEITAERKIALLLDEAFIDYDPTHSLTRCAVEHPHMIAFRSVTKFFAIPGLRVAYAVCNSAQAETMNRSIAPWPITTFASHAVCAALVDEGYAEESRMTNERRRSWLEHQLNQLRIGTFRSGANFLLLRFPARVDVNLLWEKMIVEQHIVLRSCMNYEGLEMGYLRVAVRSEQENERLIAGLKWALGEHVPGH